MYLEQRERELILAGPPGIGEYLSLLRRLRILSVNYPVLLREMGPDYFNERPQEIVYESSRLTIITRPLDHRIFSLGYRIEEKPRPGRFDVEGARELGIPVGPLFSELQSGNEITLADGRVISPSQVLGPPRLGKSVAYCLDTRPCENAVLLARNADWLIYEATFTSEFMEEARQYGHSTAAQAAMTAREAHAKNLLITHFSSRYPSARPLLEEARTIFSQTTTAEDLLEIEV